MENSGKESLHLKRAEPRSSSADVDSTVPES